MKISLTLILLLIIGDLSAQDVKLFAFQFDFGTNISVPYRRTIKVMPEFERTPETNYSTGYGYFAEIMFSYNFNAKLGLQRGLNFNQNQLKIIDEMGLIESKGTLNTSYIHIPILCGIRYLMHRR